ncbi:hypothetical protein [Rhodoferax sp.]|nr:hypothetical protein [Rhodoferax sp.]MDZ7921555.1 hypothetical protein [Rhodoferax sp.]
MKKWAASPRGICASSFFFDSKLRLLAIVNNRWRDQMVAGLRKTGRIAES